MAEMAAYQIAQARAKAKGNVEDAECASPLLFGEEV
jgi:hypothetical protein